MQWFQKCSRLTGVQILSITCDNASVNDAMIEKLSKLVPNYLGKETHIHCFLRVLNLVAKAVIKMFDVPKGKNPNEMSDAKSFLAKLAEGIELEEKEMRAKETGKEEEDNIDNLGESEGILSVEEREAFEEGILPVQLVIVKVRQHI